MPCPHFKISITQRSKGQSAVAGAAYQSGSRLFSEYDQIYKSYTGKKEVLCSEILLPEHAPPEYSDRNVLWNSVEEVEKQWNAQLARKIVLALPREVPADQYQQMLRDFCNEYFVSKGMCVDYAVHDKGDGNPHAHIMLTMRAIDENGKWLPKSRKVYDLNENGEKIKLPSGNFKSHKEDTVDWNEQSNAEVWRHGWEVITNEYLEKNERSERIDLRSFKRQGIDLTPTVHMGPAASALEKKGVKTLAGDLNRDIKKSNQELTSIRKMKRDLEDWISETVTGIKELITEFLNESRLEGVEVKSPNLFQALLDYQGLRKSERADWSSFGKQQAELKDFKKVSSAIAYLRDHNISTLDDLQCHLTASEEKASNIRQQMKPKERRMKEINKVISAIETCEKLKPVHDEYTHIGWKSKKEKFAAEHPELADYDKAFRLLKAHPGDEQLGIKVLKAEYKNLDSERNELQKSLESVRNDMKPLKDIRYYVGKVLPAEVMAQAAIDQTSAMPGEPDIGRESVLTKLNEYRQQPVPASDEKQKASGEKQEEEYEKQNEQIRRHSSKDL